MRTMRRINRDEQIDINLAPMVDMIFILLIFFIVTTSFVREAGLDVHRPEARTATAITSEPLILSVTADGSISLDGKTFDLRALRPRLDRFAVENPEGSVVVVADRDCPTGITVRVLDVCRLSGIHSVSLGARTVDNTPGATP